MRVDLGEGIRGVFTTARGGASTGEHATLNLSLSVGDDPEAVLANRRAVAAEAGFDADRLVLARQVHDADVVHVTDQHAGRGARSHDDVVASCDGMVTAAPQVPLAVLAADCAPVLIGDPHRRVVAVAHAGWRGAVARVVQRTVERMVAEHGSDPAGLRVVIGPHIGTDSFEMGPTEAEACAAEFPATDVVHHDRGPKPHVDLRAMLLAQLADAGVDPSTVQTIDADTMTDDTWFSHRRSTARSGRTGGRFAGIAWLARDGRKP